MSTENVYSNEKWWQEHGGEWADVVWERKASQPLYGIQEVVLSSYFSQLPPSRILEFGPGFGRHVGYLYQLQNLEVYGVDQSPTMIESLSQRLSEQKDLLNRIVLIQPREKLPFPDNFFDVVYTVSVLIHIRPEHLKEILSELIRVSKHGILHFENNVAESTEMTAPDHDGCWAHPLVQVYEELGCNAAVLTKPAIQQDLYFVKLSDDSRYDFSISPIVLHRLKELDDRILPHMAFMEGEIGWMKAELAERQKREAEMNQKMDYLNAQISQLQAIKSDLLNELERMRETIQRKDAQINTYQLELQEIYSSLAWKWIKKIRNQKGLYALSKPARRLLKGQFFSNDSEAKESLEVKQPVSENIKWFKNQLLQFKGKESIAIHHPDWLGVTNSTKELFDCSVGLKEIYLEEEAELAAVSILECGFQTVIFSGVAVGYSTVMKILKRRNPSLKILLLWHGNTTHMYEDYSWARHQEIMSLCRDGIIDTWGFAKKSMAELYSTLGIETRFVMNYMRNGAETIEIQQDKSESKTQIKIGLYASGATWNKNAYTQIAAASLIGNVTIYAIPSNDRMKQFANEMKVELVGIDQTTSRQILLDQMRKNDLNLYVTFSECAPLLPLESLSVGVPCLTGPNHHYFKGTPLEKYLVVQSPDDPVEISEKARIALAERDTIINLYKTWVEEYNERAKQSVIDFLGRGQQ